MYSDKNPCRMRRRLRGECIECGEKSSRSRCDSCRSRNSSNKKSWRGDNREKDREVSVRIRQKRRDDGRCSRCGVPLDPDADPGRVSCMNCRQRVAIKKIQEGF